MVMERRVMRDLIRWKGQKNRKPLIIQGARQVGKTWLMKAFGRSQYRQVAYINFESSTRLQSVFVPDFDLTRIVTVFEIETGLRIDAAETLLILDEIQEAEKGLSALKYFQENAPDYHVVAAGSLLGISLQQHSFPVGKVDFLQLHPLSFEEFLVNAGEEQLVSALLGKEWSVLEPFHEKLVQYLRVYYYVGGMPEAVKTYLETTHFQQVRSVQQNILLGYENDFARYAPIEIVPRIRLVWQSVLGQLAKENRKFIYGQLKKGARAREFETAIYWLVNAGLLVKCKRVAKPTVPLRSYADTDAFKLFLVDIGLLCAMAGLSEQILLAKNQILTEFKGALTEQFVSQQLCLSYDLYYWSADQATAELDFLLQKDGALIPVEVKAEENLKAKSLSVFEQAHKTGQALRFSMSPFRQQDWMVNMPLYAVCSL
jgi:predicted AAA+ superfamily ATPase